MSPDKLIYMASQMGKFFVSQGPDKAAAAIAEHITKFWDPRMRRTIIDHMQQADVSVIDPLVVQAVQALKPVPSHD